jgi:RNA polymerase sigma-70 factor, ECF subfamily
MLGARNPQVLRAMEEIELEVRRCLLAVATRDVVAFRRLYDLALPRMRAVCAIILRHRGDVDDVLQMVFVRIWLRAQDYRRESGSAMGWMTSICRNAAIDVFRQERAQKRREQFGGELLETLALPSRNAQSDLTRSLAALPRDQAAALSAIYAEGLTHEEFAVRSGWPLGTVKSRVRRGLRALRGLLQDGGS